jgi:putative transposase
MRWVYCELSLQLRNKTPPVKANLRDEHKPATRSNETWAMDFVHDQLAAGSKLRAHGRRHLLPFLAGAGSAVRFRGTDVVALLERVWEERGASGVGSMTCDVSR